jgi:hypothetical protein
MFENFDPTNLVSVFLLVFYGCVAVTCSVETLLESRRARDRSDKGWRLAIVIGLLWPLPILFVGFGCCLAFVSRRRSSASLN